MNISKVMKVLMQRYSPISSDPHNAPSDRKNEYIVMVSMKMNNRLMKNWEGVRERFAMLQRLSIEVEKVMESTYK
jgi:hypothetical protein